MFFSKRCFAVPHLHYFLGIYNVFAKLSFSFSRTSSSVFGVWGLNLGVSWICLLYSPKPLTLTVIIQKAALLKGRFEKVFPLVSLVSLVPLDLLLFSAEYLLHRFLFSTREKRL